MCKIHTLTSRLFPGFPPRCWKVCEMFKWEALCSCHYAVDLTGLIWQVSKQRLMNDYSFYLCVILWKNFIAVPAARPKAAAWWLNNEWRRLRHQRSSHVYVVLSKWWHLISIVMIAAIQRMILVVFRFLASNWLFPCQGGLWHCPTRSFCTTTRWRPPVVNWRLTGVGRFCQLLTWNSRRTWTKLSLTVSEQLATLCYILSQEE